VAPDAARHAAYGAPARRLTGDRFEGRRPPVLWLIIGVILLIIAIAGGAIIHPVLFVLGILALLAFFVGGRRRTAP
jgi:hypothetical protein